MNEQSFANSIKQYLNLCTQRMDPGVAERLRQARTAALSRYAERKPAWRLAWVGHGIGSEGHGAPHWWSRRWVPLLLLVLLALSMTYWHYSDQGPEPGEIDALLLADDLPVGAYLDHRFDAWLKREQQ